jgi:RNA polymerase sigma-B factor
MTSLAAASGPHRVIHCSSDQLFVSWQQDGDPAARDALVERFLPLARSLARRYARSSEPFEDLLQVASLGLLKAIDRFDSTRGRAFTSFAVPTILGELRRYFRDCGWSVHVPRRDQEHALRVERAGQQLLADRGRPPTVADLAEYLELSTEDVLGAVQAVQAYRAVSLDEPRASGEGQESSTYADTCGEVDERYGLVEAQASIAAAAKHLGPRERLVLRMRFEHDMTQSEIAARIGISQMHVSRLLRRSLEQLRILTRADEEAD